MPVPLWAFYILSMGGTSFRWGDILVGKYRVERVLGQGNMGIVVAATHIALGQLVALKFLLANRRVGQEQLERFMREGRAAAVLKSAHVVRVLDFGALEDGAPYMAMEHLEGRDLKAVLAERGPLPVVDAVEYVLQACEAIGEAHAMGVVHRDIKPGNLFLTADVSHLPCVKIFDFGISKLDSELTLTQETASMGSPLYMSPEQLNASHDVDGRADIWSLGASLFELLAGQTPFHAETTQQLCYRIFSGRPTPLSQLRPDVPAGLEAVIMRCLERDRNRRFENIAELAAALAPWAPARAAAYPERVARVLNVQTATSMLPAPGREPLAASIRSNAAGIPGPSTGDTMLLPVRSDMASSPVTGTQDTVLTRSTPHDARTGGQAPVYPAGGRRPGRLRPVMTFGAIGVVALTVALGVKLRHASTSDGVATAATPPSVVAPAAAAVPEVSAASPPLPINEAASASPVAVVAPALSTSMPSDPGTARSPPPRSSPSSHAPVRPRPIPTLPPRDTIE